MCFFLIDTVASTVQATVDTTKNVASAAVDKGTSLVGTTVDVTKNAAATAVDKSTTLIGSAKGRINCISWNILI